jgi:hypothetical protein
MSDNPEPVVTGPVDEPVKPVFETAPVAQPEAEAMPWGDQHPVLWLKAYVDAEVRKVKLMFG